jgi:hypothetical protein
MKLNKKINKTILLRLKYKKYTYNSFLCLLPFVQFNHYQKKNKKRLLIIFILWYFPLNYDVIYMLYQAFYWITRH